MLREKWKIAAAGVLAGMINGLLGTGGGMLLVPLLTWMTDIAEEDVFASSVSIILPISLVSVVFGIGAYGLPVGQAFPYLIGSTLGGVAAGFFGKKIPTLWLHKTLGILILWGGIRYLC